MQTIAVYPVEAGNFTLAGEASGQIKRMLKRLGVDAGVVRRVAVGTYEAEINLVIHTNGGEIAFEMSAQEVIVTIRDTGPGIPDIDKAMTEGFSTASEDARNMGFGAGMGLPNMKRNADSFSIESQIGVGTTITMGFRINPED